MRNSLKKVIMMVGSILLALLVVYFLILFIDTQYDRVVANWFEDRFTNLYHYGGSGSNYVIPKIDWPAIKSFALWACGICVVLFVAAVYIAVWVTQYRAEQKILHEASLYMKAYLSAEKDEMPAGKYRELASTVGEFKSKMRHNERVLQDETSKKNDLIAYLAHDLKTPLTSVIGYLTLLEEAPDMPLEQKARYTHIALQKAERLEKLINEFFEITRYNLHEIVLEKESINLYYMLVQMADEFYPVLQKNQNEITIQAPEELYIYADPVKLARVFNNILRNAIAYSNPGSTIKITAEKGQSEVRLCFINEGKTIPEHKMQTIFEKFYRLDESRSTNNGGAGLGLAIAKEIVRLHNGTIFATSQNGITAFSVALPVQSE